MALPEKHCCSACSVEMELAMIIPPFRAPYGLKIYTCPKCGRSEDYLIDPASKAA
jgi:predicted  nucleic acid-binding Zn-ribbon protein